MIVTHGQLIKKSRSAERLDRPDLLLEFAECVRLLVSAVRTIVLRISELRISFGLLKPDVLAPACRALRIMFDACSACYLIELIYFDIILFHCLILLYQRVVSNYLYLIIAKH